jgi:hypothetical protein
MRGFLANESVGLLGLCDTIAHTEKVQIVALSIMRLATGHPGSIAEAKATVVMIYKNSQNWCLQLWDQARESLPPRPPAQRRAQTFIDWSATTNDELEHELKHFVELVDSVRRHRQGVAGLRLSFNTLKFARGVVCAKIWQLLISKFSSLPQILAACYMILTSLLFSSFSYF